MCFHTYCLWAYCTTKWHIKINWFFCPAQSKSTVEWVPPRGTPAQKMSQSEPPKTGPRHQAGFFWHAFLALWLRFLLFDWKQGLDKLLWAFNKLCMQHSSLQDWMSIQSWLIAKFVNRGGCFSWFFDNHIQTRYHILLKKLVDRWTGCV